MKRIKLIVAYEGSAYHGWQYQTNAVTIEAILNKTLSQLLQEEITVIGASRTDAGVHSMGNVAVFDTNTRIPAEKLSYALNQRLPQDIVVQDSREVMPDFHPRFCESRKIYEYRILNRKFPMPLYRRNTYFHHYPLEISKMKKAAEYLIGEHDFASFCSLNTQVESTIRTIYSLEIQVTKLESFRNNHECENELEQGQLITIRITGNGFLYNMVRIIAGTLLQIGSAKKQPEEIQHMLEQKNRAAAGPTAPAVGLTMIGIEYL